MAVLEDSFPNGTPRARGGGRVGRRGWDAAGSDAGAAGVRLAAAYRYTPSPACSRIARSELAARRSRALDASLSSS